MKLMVLDGNSIVNRAYYGVGKARLLTTRQGLHTNAIYGFVTMLQKLLDQEKPDAVCAAFDRREPTFRHKADAAYKANRKGMPEELAEQMLPLKQVLDAMSVPCYELSGYEADDLIGTISRKCEAAGWDCTIATGDRDSLQLITAHTHVRLLTGGKGPDGDRCMTESTFRAEYGFDPIHMIDLKALAGDSSDNIPGVPGIGEKTAMALVQQYGSIDAVYANIDSVPLKPGFLCKLKEGEASARHSYWLATIDTNAPLDFDPEDNLRQPFKPELYDLFLKLEFQKLIDKYQLSPACVAEELPTYTAEAEILETAERAEACLALWREAAYVTVYGTPDLAALAVECETGADSSLMVEIYVNRYAGDWRALLSALVAPDIRKVGHNGKDMMRALLAQGLPADGFIFDTALAAYLVDATAGSYDLQRLFVTYYNEQLPQPDHLTADAFNPLAGENIAAQTALISYTAAVSALHGTLAPKLRELEMEELYYNVELPLCRVLADMETAGFLVDRDALADFGAALQKTTDRVEQAIYDAAGETFNINSPKQLGYILFEKLQLPHGKKTKTGWSTNADVLEKLRHAYPIVDDVLCFRQYTKLKSTYVDGLMKVIDMDGRIRTSFQMTVTATGQLHGAEFAEYPHTHRAGQPAAADVHGGGGLCAGGCGLLPDRAAPAGAYVRRQGHAGVIPVRHGLPHRHRRQGLPRAGGGCDAGAAPPGQGGEFRHCVRHFRLCAGPGHRRHRGRGQGVHGPLFRDVQHPAAVYDRRSGAGGAGRLRADHDAPPPPPAGAEEQQFQPAGIRQAGGAEYAGAGQRRRYHEAGDGACA